MNSAKKSSASRSGTGRSTKPRPASSPSADVAALIRSYTVLLEPQEQGGYRARTLELPFVVGFGDNVASSLDELYTSLEFTVTALAREGVEPPVPASRGLRSEQVNVKLTHREKAMITDAAKRSGFRSMSDFLRSLAMRE